MNAEVIQARVFHAKAPPTVSKKMLTPCPRAGVDRLDFYSTFWVAYFYYSFQKYNF